MNLIRIAVEKVRHRRPRTCDHAIRIVAGVVSPAGVGIVVRQIARDSVNYALRNLRPAGPVEENGRLAVNGLRKRRKL